MTVRLMVANDPGVGPIGSVAESVHANAKKRPIANLQVYPSTSYAGRKYVKVDMVTESESQYILNLSTNAVLEMVKGLLQNLDYITIAADEELRNIMSTAIKQSDEEAKAMVDCLKRSNPST